MADILTSFYGFSADEIRTIVDESVTRNNLMNRFDWLLDDVKEGVFLTVCIDSCHSETATRDIAFLTSELQISPAEIKLQPRFIEPPADIALRRWCLVVAL